MTPAERIAELRLLVAKRGILFYVNEQWNSRVAAALLALAEAVPARLAMSHHAHCRKVTEMLGGQRRRVACTCGHDELAAAWAALGDE